jgi:xylulose-5-phosphate/fructose-6-phosphate phosphoketolase
MLIHRLTYRRTNHRNIHVHGYNEEGTTTTPFDMVVLNKISRFHLAALAVKQSSLPAERIAELVADLDAREAEAVRYTREHFEDPAEIRDWRWSN